MLQIGNKQAYIINGNIGVSYNTPICIKIGGVLFITENSYSNTTAHHKTDFKRILGGEVVEVQHTVLIDLINNDINAAEILQENKTKQYLIKSLEKNNSIPNNIKVYAAVEKTNSSKQLFKNSNEKIKTSYKTTFKYVSNFNFKITVHIFNNAPAPKLTVNKHEHKIKNICIPIKRKAVISSY